MAADENKFHRDLAKLLLGFGLLPQGSSVENFRRLVPNIPINADLIEPLYFEIYEEEKAKIKEMLRNYDGKITLSIDILDVEYMCVTAHFMSDEWKKKKLVLFCRSVCRGDLGMDEAIVKCIADFEIEDKIFALTTTSCVDFDEEFYKGINDVIRQKKRVVPVDGLLFRVTCCADLFSSIVQNVFKKLDDVMYILHLLHSPGWSEPVWNCTLAYLDKVLTFEAEGEYNDDNKDMVDYEVPTSTEWDEARGVCKLVSIIKRAAYVMFETRNATANVYLHLLREVQEALTRESTNPDKFVADLATKMVKSVNAYCKDMFMILALTAVMDPRFKMKYIEFSCSKYVESSTTEGFAEVSAVLEAIRKLYEGYVIENHVEENTEGDSSSSDDMEEDDAEEDDSEKEYMKAEDAKIQEKCQECYNEFSMFNEYRQLVESETHSVKSELDCYLEEPVLAWKQDFSVLDWWKSSSSKYPALSKMARDILTIQMTVSTSYYNYYTQHREVDPRLESTSPELMNIIMCASSWI